MLASPVPTGLAVLDMAQAGRFADIRELYAPKLRAMVAAGALQAAWEAELARQGPVSFVRAGQRAGRAGWGRGEDPRDLPARPAAVLVSAGDKSWEGLSWGKIGSVVPVTAAARRCHRTAPRPRRLAWPGRCGRG